MRKWLISLVIIFGLLLMAIFLFFPTKVDSSNNVKIHCGITATNRFLTNENQWGKWWPGSILPDSNTHKNIYEYHGYRYIVTNFKYNAIQIQTLADGVAIDGTIYLISLSIDSVQAEWKYSLVTTSNPINRIHLYNVTKKVNNNIIAILQSMKTYLGNPDNVYGMHINEEIVKDTILITTRFITATYPSRAKIYNAIDSIKSYIRLNNAIETNPPMLHILFDSSLYKTQVAIPVNIVIPENNIYFTRRMVPGKILVAQIKGGEYSTSEALRQMGLFMSDNALSSPAIPFESLITDRMQEPDTSKWITKIYYPVF